MKKTLVSSILIILIVIVFSAWKYYFSRPQFDPSSIASFETKMWQSYYGQDKMRLGFYLVSMLRSILGISFFEAQEIGELYASSAMKFKNASGNYEEIALPDLILAYSKIQKATGRSFAPEKAARAELAWWVARRSSQNSEEEVGGKIAELYAILYGEDKAEFYKAGLLRARAAKVRDAGKENADWNGIENILKESYSCLEKGIK